MERNKGEKTEMKWERQEGEKRRKMGTALASLVPLLEKIVHGIGYMPNKRISSFYTYTTGEQLGWKAKKMHLVFVSFQ